MDIDDEVFRDNLVFVLTNIFGTQLHLASLDIVSTLDESSIKHDPEHDFIGEASVLEDYLYVTLQHH